MPKELVSLIATALMHCYVLSDRTQQIRLLDFAGGVDRERVEAKVFQLNRATKLPIRTTHSDHMRLDLLNGFAFKVLHDGERFLPEGRVRCSDDYRLPFVLVFLVPNSVGHSSPVI